MDRFIKQLSFYFFILGGGERLRGEFYRKFCCSTTAAALIRLMGIAYFFLYF